MLSRLFFLTGITMIASNITGCNFKTDDISGGTQASGQVTLKITDAPSDEAARVVISFDGVIFKGLRDTADVTINFEDPIVVDVLQYQNGNTFELLTNQAILEGDYRQIQLLVNTDQLNDSFIELNNGQTYELEMSDDNPTALSVTRNISIDRLDTLNFTIDIDLRQAIVLSSTTPIEYQLRSTLRIVDTEQSGRITGSIRTDVCNSSAQKAIYIYAGNGQSVDDIGSNNGPIATTSVNQDLTYTAAFLDAGNYILALNCRAIDDDPLIDDVSFGAAATDGVNGFARALSDIEVTAKQTSTLNFE